MIYQPAEDSYLLQEAIKDFLKDKNKDLKILDMGGGSGIQAQTCLDLGFEDVLAVDINKEVIGHLMEKKINVIESDLFSAVNKDNKYDLIIFNAPYLPEDAREPEDIKLATTAGPEGYEVIIRFLEESKTHLATNARILLLFSSLSQLDVILRKANELGYKYKLVKEMSLDFEKLFVYEFFA